MKEEISAVNREQNGEPPSNDITSITDNTQSDNISTTIPQLATEASEAPVQQSSKANEEAKANAVADTKEESKAEAPKRVKRKRSKIYMVWYTIIKRCFDFLSSLIVSLLLSPVYLVVTIIMLFKSFGSPLYKQVRLGKRGKVLKIYKFRSMRKGADNLEKFLTPEQLEEYKQEFKLKDDPRLIGYKHPGDGEKEKCFGAKIRKTSIDELPQIFFNICILGNMSVVGPRPILREELEKNYTPDEQKILLSSKPGLTGYWQAYARNNATYASGERQKMELYYAEHKSLWLDFKIIFRTFISVLRKDGAE